MLWLKAGETRAFSSPGSYIQGPGEIHRLPEVVKSYGTNALLLIDPFFFDEYESIFISAFKEEGLGAYCIKFCGECNEEEIERVCEYTADKDIDIFIGVGGGKTMDAIKAIAIRCEKPMIICPTVLSTDAATSKHSIVYRADHTYYPLWHYRNPEYVIVDTEIAVQAPARMFAAGMGDALATYPEARGYQTVGQKIQGAHGKEHGMTRTGMALAKLCYDIILEQGRDAYLAARHHIRTAAFEDVAEANTLLSGVGCENTGSTVAHGVWAAFSILPETATIMHGELVAFGILCQLVMEKWPRDEFIKIFTFCRDVGLPVCLADLGICDDIDAKLDKAVAFGVANKQMLHIEPFAVTEQSLKNAILYVDAFAKEY